MSDIEKNGSGGPPPHPGPHHPPPGPHPGPAHHGPPPPHGGQVNHGFAAAPELVSPPAYSETEPDIKSEVQEADSTNQRATWDNPLEFLMSCIATSVGLGNVWRFPFVAYQNGGGAFLIPYIILLLIVGKPLYYLETFIGQFSSSNCVRIWAMAPAMKGTGYAQALSAIYVNSYYVSIVGMCLYYMVMSFQSTLPWAVCQPEWGPECVPSGGGNNTGVTDAVSSAELYYKYTVLKQIDGIEDGIGYPLWHLSLCLFVSWLIIFLIMVRGVKSSGKASYFLALFPYVVLLILLVRAVTLEGAAQGIIFLLTPDFDKIMDLSVWYAATSQVFFSLSVCSGSIIMFSSYNNIRQNVYRDAMIVTTLDTFTSLMAGITIFGVLGNLAHELGVEDIQQVVGTGGSSLAFVSYPDAIAKFTVVPQLFSVLFFLMMMVLGLGSGVALLSCVTTIILDAFPRARTPYVVGCSCFVGFLVGLVYCTPGGQYILELVDHYGGSFMRLFAAIAETIGIFWIYGVENLCLDVEFALNIKTSFYWRLCWTVVTPVLMTAAFLYAMFTTDRMLFGGHYVYPDSAYIAGSCLQYFGIALVPIFIVIVIFKYRSDNFVESVKRAFRKKPAYGPKDSELHALWKDFRRDAKYERELQRTNIAAHFWNCLTGGYRRKQMLQAN